MVFNKDLLFIHIGKSDGMPTSNYFIQNLAKPVTVDNPGLSEKAKMSTAFFIEGRIHATIQEAKIFLKKTCLLNIKDFKYIVATFRNPYDLEFSLFHHWKKKVKNKSLNNKKIKEILSSNSFDNFLEDKLYHRQITGYYSR